jgi:aspartate aminotransferase
MYHQEELAKIAEICVAHKIYVISDEIYEKLIYDTTVFTSIGSLGKDIFDLTLTVNGVSKAYAMTGWRIGYAAGPLEIMEYIKKYQDHSTSNPSSISQAAALEALKASPESIDQMCQVFKKRRDLMLQCLDRIKELSYIRPEGAFYVFCDFSKIGDATVIAKQILDEIKVAGIPGEGFGSPNYIRFSFATSDERIQEGTARVAKWISNQTSKLKA